MTDALGAVRCNRKMLKDLVKKRLKKGEVDRRTCYGLLAANGMIAKMFTCCLQKISVEMVNAARRRRKEKK